MKKRQLLTVLAFTLPSLSVQADVGFPVGPGGPKQSIDIEQLKEKVKAQIKNEKHSGSSKSKTTNPFGNEYDYGNKVEDANEQEVEINQLTQSLQERLSKEELVKFYDYQTLDNVLSFSALALQAWNPELKNATIKTQIVRNIVNFGFMKGFVTPMMSLMDLSYATGKPQFGNLLNVMLMDIAPTIAIGFEKNYNIPTSINGLNFTQLSAHGRDYMWKVLTSQLDSEFYANHKNSLIDAKLNDRINPMKYNDKSMDHFINNTVKSDKSYLSQYFKMIGHENTELPSKSGLTEEKKKQNSEKFLAQRGVFTNSLASESNTCLAKCMDEVGDRAVKYGDSGQAIGNAVGAIVGKMAKVGAVAGAGIGGLIGQGGGMVVGAVVGGYECSKSSECGGKDKAKEKEIKEQKEKEAKEQKEKINKEQSENKKQQDDVKKQQEENKKQQEKHKNDVKKQEELKKQQQQLEKRQAELKKKEEELKRKEEDLKKQEEEDKKKEEESKQNDANQEGSDLTKTMLKDDEGKPDMSFEEQQKLKKSSTSTPMCPRDDFTTGSGNPVSKLDYIKVMEKDKNSASEQKPVLIYPQAPNMFD